jgi:hypothetical protein
MAMVSAPIPAFPRKRGKELNSGDDALPALPRPPPAGEGWDGGGMPMTDSQLFPFPRLRGKVGMGATFLQRANDVRDDIVDASQYFIIPVAPHAIPVLRQPLVACGIVGRIQMLTTVDFNYQSRRKANEIDDVRADRVLSAKLHTELGQPEHTPQRTFGFGHVLAQLTGKRWPGAFTHVVSPHPSLPPHAGEGV